MKSIRSIQTHIKNTTDINKRTPKRERNTKSKTYGGNIKIQKYDNLADLKQLFQITNSKTRVMNKYQQIFKHVNINKTQNKCNNCSAGHLLEATEYCKTFVHCDNCKCSAWNSLKTATEYCWECSYSTALVTVFGSEPSKDSSGYWKRCATTLVTVFGLKPSKNVVARLLYQVASRPDD